jgi:hypothetical protein
MMFAYNLLFYSVRREVQFSKFIYLLVLACTSPYFHLIYALQNWLPCVPTLSPELLDMQNAAKGKCMQLSRVDDIEFPLKGWTKGLEVNLKLFYVEKVS